jgi:hypothetical protein
MSFFVKKDKGLAGRSAKEGHNAKETKEELKRGASEEKRKRRLSR